MNVVIMSQASYLQESPWSEAAQVQARALAGKLVATVGALDPQGDIRAEEPQTSLRTCELAIPAADALVAFLDAARTWHLHREAAQVANLLRMIVITAEAAPVRDAVDQPPAERRLDMGWVLALVQEKLDGINAALEVEEES